MKTHPHTHALKSSLQRISIGLSALFLCSAGLTPAFAESLSGSTLVSVTVTSAPPPLGGGWQYYRTPFFSTVSPPIVVEQNPAPIDIATVVAENVPTPGPVVINAHQSKIVLSSSVSSEPTHSAAEEMVNLFTQSTGAGNTDGRSSRQVETPNGSAVTPVLIDSDNHDTLPLDEGAAHHSADATVPSSKVAPTALLSNISSITEPSGITVVIVIALLSLLAYPIVVLRKGLDVWRMFNTFVLFSIMTYGGIVVLEYVGAASTTVGFVITNPSLSISCDASATLGTITVTGDTGPYAPVRSTNCTISTTASNGYSLQWRVSTGSGGTATGTLISESSNTIAAYTPLTAGTPETWSVASSDSEWGGRLSSTSTTVSTATWGTDSSSERWLNVSTGGTTIANRSSPTINGSPDTERIGFRAQIGAAKNQPVGTYQANIVLTAITN